MNRKILFSLAVASLLFSCSSDDSSDSVPDEEGMEEGMEEVVPVENPEGTSGEEESPSADCDSNVASFTTKPSDFEISSTTVDGKFIRNSTDQVQAALDASGEGGVVWLEDETWLIDRDLVPKFNNTTIVGGTLKRADALSSTLTQAVSVGDSVLNVANSDEFYPGLIITVSKGDNFEETMFPQVFVATVEPGRVTLGSPATMDFEPGAVVFNVSTLLKINENTVTNTVVSNVVFDGNVENNNFTFDWRLNTGIVLSGREQVVECSQLVNSPCESMLGHNVTVRNTSGENLFGSFFHASAFESGTILIENCTTNDTNKAAYAQNGHNEGTITLSANSGNMTVRDSEFTLGGLAAWGDASDDDCNILATNTTFTDHVRKYFAANNLPDAPCFDDTDVIYVNTPD